MPDGLISSVRRSKGEGRLPLQPTPPRLLALQVLKSEAQSFGQSLVGPTSGLRAR